MQPKKKRRWLRRCVLWTALVVTCTAGLTVYLLKRPPLAWRLSQEVLNQSTPEMREQISAGLRDRLANIAQKQTGQEEQVSIYSKFLHSDAPDQISDTPLDQFVEMQLTNAELIAMVNEFFVEWTEQRGYIVPGGVNDPVVIAHNGRLLMTFMVHTPYWQQVFSGEVDLTFRSDGMAIGKVDTLNAGSLPVSLLSIGEWLKLQMPASEHETAERLGEWLGNLEHFEFRPVLELEHRRRARVLAMAVGDDSVTLKMRVQDHVTYRGHNKKLQLGQMAVTDTFKEPIHPALQAKETGLADVPTNTD